MPKPTRIAIVDDNADIRYMVSELCKTEGWTPVPCADHREARTLLLGEGADLFIVDYHLPEVDGVSIVRMIRDHLPTVPILVLTVEEKPAVLGRFMEAGASDYALKPIKALDLISRLKVHLAHHEQSRYYINEAKGIGPVVLRSIQSFLAKQEDYVDIGQIAAGMQISRKSVYRYLKYMQAQGMIDVTYDYTAKLGRPKAYYRLCSERPLGT